MEKLSQTRAPIYEALEAFRKQRVVPFDVPGHKRGRGNPELAELLGEKCVGMDVNSMKPLDNVSSNLGDPGSRGTGGRGIWSSTCISDGRRNNLGGTEYGAFHCEARGEDHSSEKCTPERDGSNGVVRSDSGICQSGVR